MNNPIDELLRLIKESGVQIRFGLRQQGHIPTVERMLGESASWDEIGGAIGWHGPTAKQWYEREMQRQDTKGGKKK